MAARVLLGLQALLWLPYGFFLLFQPGYLQTAAGVTASTPTGVSELRAMYGGLQIAIGALALAGCLRPELTRAVLRVLVVLCAGLGSARLLGVALDGELSSYTLMGLVFEWGTVLLAGFMLRRAPAAGPAYA